jgi:plastocyanin
MKSGKKIGKRSYILMLFLVAVAIMNSCKKNDDYQPMSSSSSSNPPANEVWIQGGNTYNPSAITVSVNTTVTWKNKDSYYTHTVTSNSGEFDSGVIAINGTYSHKFTAAGTYPYHCTLHTMSGQVIVQ